MYGHNLISIGWDSWGLSASTPVFGFDVSWKFLITVSAIYLIARSIRFYNKRK